MKLALAFFLIEGALGFATKKVGLFGRLFGQLEMPQPSPPRTPTGTKIVDSDKAIRLPSGEEKENEVNQYAKNNVDIGNILAMNRDWVKQKYLEDTEFFKRLGSKHTPSYLWIGCVDARVPANEIMGLDAGTVLVARNVANMVVNTDNNLMAALHFAVEVLGVAHILVVGHYDCGGIRASMRNVDHGAPLEQWLRNIRDVYRIHQAELDAIGDPEARHRRMVELNVIEQCVNVYKSGHVQKIRAKTFEDPAAPISRPQVHGLVFDPKVGELMELDVDYDKYMSSYRMVYELYTPPEPAAAVVKALGEEKTKVPAK